MELSVLSLLFFYLGAVNFISFLAMALDKRKARLGQWRIPERTLLLLFFSGGSLGGLLAMLLCRHKTKTLKFRVLTPLFLLLHAALLCLTLLFYSREVSL